MPNRVDGLQKSGHVIYAEHPSRDRDEDDEQDDLKEYDGSQEMHCTLSEQLGQIERANKRASSPSG
jgi:hypothetical protein